MHRALENALLDGNHPAHVLPPGHEVIVGGQRPLVGIPHSVSRLVASRLACVTGSNGQLVLPEQYGSPVLLLPELL